MKSQNIEQTNVEFDPDFEIEIMLKDAKNTATFLSTVADNFGFNINSADLSASDWGGLFAILKNHSKNIETVEEICMAYKAAIKKRGSPAEVFRNAMKHTVPIEEGACKTDPSAQNVT
ncbi:MAG: hypothetical protein K9G33_11445 [Sneathiella sp.]|nr:hypothetical protein [Sneathiella sp.]